MAIKINKKEIILSLGLVMNKKNIPPKNKIKFLSKNEIVLLNTL
jgi:hypothetical protein